MAESKRSIMLFYAAGIVAISTLVITDNDIRAFYIFVSLYTVWLGSAAFDAIRQSRLKSFAIAHLPIACAFWGISAYFFIEDADSVPRWTIFVIGGVAILSTGWSIFIDTRER